MYPQLVGYANPITITVKPHDLGDAPDSSNHSGAGMLAYPAVPARYPTVFDPAAGTPQGPSHSKPTPFHLGQRVSLEVEADQGLEEMGLYRRPAAACPLTIFLFAERGAAVTMRK